MAQFKLSLSPKPSLRVYRKSENGERVYYTKLKGWKVTILKETLLSRIPAKTVKQYRNGLIFFEIDEESALRIILAAQTVKTVINREKVRKIANGIAELPSDEIYWWYRLYLKYGRKALNALKSVLL
ncbi:hypothetical protein [Thermococcus sp. M39]|uniref:DUF7680 family protein n=1 Tax=Thermococcus sp. M39 TaxID=1638262 RepID=UPI0014388F54|nr:hypothetical protein [Thermococcus sp. M39]